ncbi:MAG: hypothetical protein AB8I80_12185, partial [Anaerolineae bacterium]
MNEDLAHYTFFRSLVASRAARPVVDRSRGDATMRHLLFLLFSLPLVASAETYPPVTVDME